MVQVTAPPSMTPQQFVLDAARATAFAEACGGAFVPGPDHVAPPMAVAIGTLVQGVQPVLQEVLRASGPESLLRVMHREEAITWHEILRLDTPYSIEPELLLHEQRRAGAFVHIAVSVRDRAGRLVVSSRSSLFVRPPGDAPAPVPRPPPVASAPRGQPVQQLAPWTVASDQPNRYAQASLESNPIHLSDDVAQAAGLPRRILHGMCTLAYAARALTGHARALQKRSPRVNTRLLALSARFATPVFCHDTLVCRMFAPEGATPKGGQGRLLPNGPHAPLEKVVFDVVQQDGIVVLSRGHAQF